MPDFDAEAIAREWLALRPPYEGEVGVVRACEPEDLAVFLTLVRREVLKEAAGACDSLTDTYERAACTAPTQAARGFQTARMIGAANAARQVRALIPEGSPAPAAGGRRHGAGGDPWTGWGVATVPSCPDETPSPSAGAARVARGSNTPESAESAPDPAEEAGHTPASYQCSECGLRTVWGDECDYCESDERSEG